MHAKLLLLAHSALHLAHASHGVHLIHLVIHHWVHISHLHSATLHHVHLLLLLLLTHHCHLLHLHWIHLIHLIHLVHLHLLLVHVHLVAHERGSVEAWLEASRRLSLLGLLLARHRASEWVVRHARGVWICLQKVHWLLRCLSPLLALLQAVRREIEELALGVPHRWL